MAASNLIIHTSNSLELTDINYVYFMYIKDPTWNDVSTANLTDAKLLINNKDTSTEDVDVWEYFYNEADISYKFNVIALFKELNTNLINPESGDIIESNEESSKQLLAFGNYKSYQAISLSDKWVINISSSWRFSDAEDTDPATEFEMLYNQHTIATDPLEGILPIHTRLVDSYALPATLVANNIVASYQSRGVKDETGSGEKVSSMYGLNIVSYTRVGTNKLHEAINKAEKSAQWLVLNKLGPGYEDVIALYEDETVKDDSATEDTHSFYDADYITKRITKFNYGG